MFCPDCGVKNKSSASVCFVCEKKLPVEAEPVVERMLRPALGKPARAAERMAALGDRLIAVVLDTTFLGALFLVPAVWGIVRWNDFKTSVPSLGWLAMEAGIVILLVAMFYHWLCEGIFGATLGKAMIGIRVRDEEGGRAGMGAALVRNAFRLLDGPVFYLPGFLVAVFSKRRQRLGDHAAHTVVVVSYPPKLAARIAAVAFWLASIGGALWGAYTLGGDYGGIPDFLKVR